MSSLSSNMILCSLCASLTFWKSKWKSNHYSTYAELYESAKNGCRLCCLLKTTQLVAYAQHLSSSIEQAERHHLRLDRSSGSERSRSYSTEPGFVIETLNVDVDSSFAPVSSGLHRIIFLRYPPGQGVPDMYPYVEVSSLPDSLALREWNIISRLVPAEVDFPLAMDWISDCEENHTLCSQASDSRPPSRLLDVDLRDGTPDIRLVVRVGHPIRYATLSHVWGNTQPIKLTGELYEQFMERITFDSLPKTFMDAVIATRSLGLKYLWIDSLCIMQDSPDDWEEQCQKMGEIYKNSFVTLAGPAASGCDDGFLHRRQIPDSLTLNISDGESQDDIVLSLSLSTHPYRLKLEPNSPLATRAWVLQERLLSRRVLYFGSKGMYLECFTNVRFENCHYPTILDAQMDNIVPKPVMDDLLTRDKFFCYWAYLIAEYSSMLLTKSMDRLPALSGIASELQQIHHIHYAAGLWHENLPQGLTWYISYRRLMRTTPHISKSEYLAPSWSWAAARYPISWFIYNYEYKFISALEILEVVTKAKGIDAFGMVIDGYIKVRGRRQNSLIRQYPHPNIKHRQVLYADSGSSPSERLAVYDPDDLCHVRGTEFKVLLLFLGEFTSVRESSRSVALAIEPIQDRIGVYRRIGFVSVDTYRGSSETGIGKIFDGIDDEVITII